jgi:hypothetical protein
MEKSVDANTIIVDTIKVDNYIGENTISYGKSSITYCFKYDKNFENSIYLVKGNLSYKLIKSKKIKFNDSRFYYNFQFKGITYSTGTLEEILKEYNSIIFFDEIKVFDKDLIIFKTNKETNRVFLLDGKIVNKNDSLKMNKSIPMPPAAQRVLDKN